MHEVKLVKVLTLNKNIDKSEKRRYVCPLCSIKGELVTISLVMTGPTSMKVDITIFMNHDFVYKTSNET